MYQLNYNYIACGGGLYQCLRKYYTSLHAAQRAGRRAGGYFTIEIDNVTIYKGGPKTWKN